VRPPFNAHDAPDARTDSQDSFKIDRDEGCSGTPESDADTAVKSYEEEGLQDWLAVRDDFRTWVMANAA
jgi:hypothetical protein